ncbi:MAG: EGF-like domain [Flavipsychrobacter sp.]|jgi:hypothetical protein|nr:EGF-like domain [Flavipsychrobacter sp.]
MKSIRNIAFSALLALGAFTAMTYTACNKDECEDVVCQNGGTCVDGVCQCSTGWEGTLCDTKSNAKFVGTWSVAETCGTTPSNPYQVIITADASDPTKVVVSNLGNYNCTVTGAIVFNGTVSGNTLTVNDNKCSTQMNATGTLANGVLTINYTASFGATIDNCTATLSK